MNPTTRTDRAHSAGGLSASGPVGAGASGLTCAAELAREGYEVVVFEKLSKPGGMLTHAIPEHRLRSEFVDREIAEIIDLGVER